MRRVYTLPGTLVAAGVALALLGGCAAGQPGSRPAPRSTAPQTQPAGQERVRAQATRWRQRQLAWLRQRLEVAELNLARARIAAEHGELQYNDATALAEIELELAQKRLQIFEKMTVPDRIARAELDIQQAEDSISEAEEDLYQLQLKASDEHSADQSGETAIERAKRRIARAQRDLELRREEFRVLQEVALPLEQRELELASEQKKRAWLQVQRDNESVLIDHQIAILDAEAEVMHLEQNLADLAEQIEGAKQETPD